MDLRLPDVPPRSPEEEAEDKRILDRYFSSSRNIPSPEEIAAYCRELKNDPEWIRLYYDYQARKNLVYNKKQHRMKVE
jgi:hypothetical protein